jgi:hypothetical protein
MITKRASNKANNKSSLNNDNITIDAKHSEMINHFKEQQESIPILKEELKKLVAEYNNKNSSRKNDINYIIYRDGIREKINEIKNRINTIMNNDDLNKYYLEVGTLLHSYYENVENSKNIENNYSENFEENLLNYSDVIDDEDDFDEDDEEVIETKNVSVLNFFDQTNLKDKENENGETDIPKNDSVYTSMKISDFVKEESTFKKKNVLDEYLQKIDPNYVAKIKVDINICKCRNCKSEMTVYPSDGIQICENCGLQENILIESDKPSFKDPPMEVCYFSYKRINHYNEYIGQKVNINELLISFYKFLIN